MSPRDLARDQPLTGIRIVELGRGIAAPFATRVLAEAGADVVKVELPDGDPTRLSHPIGFATWNRSKRSVVIDVDDPSARAQLHDLLARADVFVHDLPAARAAALGVTHDRHPHLIVASVPTYPANHPMADLDAADSLVQAAEGFMDEQQGHRDGPVYIRMPFPSWCAAFLLLAGIGARLVQRDRTGIARSIATSVFQGALPPAALYWQRAERLPEPPPGSHAGLGDARRGHTLPKLWPDAALSIFECGDRRWIQLAGAVGGWIESAPILEALAVADRVELSDVGVTPANRATWNEIFTTRSSDEWIDVLRRHDVPCTLSAELGACFVSEQAAANGYVVAVDDPLHGTLLQAGAPITTLGATIVRSPAPALGSTDPAAVNREWDPREPQRRVANGEAIDLPLAGMRALDFGGAVAGPFGAQCLADLGADVIKVESVEGDRSRGLTQFAGCQRGKRALAIDLKHPAARGALERLVASSDIVLHNMRMDAARRLGIDGPGLRTINPYIVFSHVSAYGTAGPLAGDPGYDPTAQAMVGWELANAGEGMPPMWLRNSVCDVLSGLAACAGATIAMLGRERMGATSEAHTSLLAVGISTSSELAVDPRSGRPTPIDVLDADQTGVAPEQRIYRLRDGWIAVAARRPGEGEAFAPFLETDMATRGVHETLRALTAAGVPATRVALDQMDDFFDSEAHRRLGVSRSLDTSAYGQIDVVAGFWDLDEQRGESIPDFAEHSVEVLAELGFDVEAIEQMVGAGLVVSRVTADQTRS